MRKLLFLLMALMVTAAATAQTRTYRGTVVNASDNEPLVGATVLPIGGGQGVATDIDGNYAITVPHNVHEIQVSYVGFTTAKLMLADNMTVKLRPSEETLDNVMVVAYGTATKESFTGSAAIVDSKTIESTQVTNALNALSGRVAGVQINNLSGQPGNATKPTMYIRGISSINAGNEPLLIVDGAPFDGNMQNINPADIASMTVLKDAASNALYGARGANGVIIITTKKGKRGAGTVTVDLKWGQNSRASQNYETITDPRQYYEVYYGALNSFATSQGLTPEQAYVWANKNIDAPGDYGLGYKVFTAPDGQYLIGQNGKFNPQATAGYMRSYRGTDYWMQPDNWMDDAYHHSLRQEYNVTFSNATDKNSFYLSVGYLDTDGIVVNTDFKRLTARLAADSQVKSYLKVGGNLSYTHYDRHAMSEDGTSNSSGNILAAAMQVAPIYPLYMRDAEGNIMYDGNGIIRYDYGGGENGGYSRPSYTNSNAFSDALLDTNERNGNSIDGLGFIEVRFLKDFKFTSNNSFNLNEYRNTDVTNPYYGSYASSNGIIGKSHYRHLGYTFQQLLDWTHDFGQHNVGILLGHENYYRKQSYLYASRSNMFDPNNYELDGAVTDGSSSSYITEYNNEGWLFRGQYNYAEKYFGSVSVRRDASSRFHPDHRWGTFWSLGGAWVISKEDWFAAPWISMLKIKASYGEQGNDNISNYLYTNTYNIVNGSGHPAATPATKGNPNITWEKCGNFNAGVEFDLFNQRLSGSIEGFYRKTSDMLSWFTLPPSFGYTGYWDNIGDMANKGLEIELSGEVVRTRNVTWSINANMTWYKNKITKLDESKKGQECDGVKGYSSGNFFYGEGSPLYNYRLFRYAGPNADTGEPMYYAKERDENGDLTGKWVATTYDKLSQADYQLCGSALPDVYGGFGTSVEAYGFDFSIDFAYQIGGQFYDSRYAGYMGSPKATSKGSNWHADILNSWTPENRNTNVPRVQFGDEYTASTSDRFLTNASYLSLQNINLGYTLPAKVTQRMYLSKVRVYFAADNVWLWSKRQGADPRQSVSGTVNNTYYAPIRTLSGGIQVTF